MLTVVGVAMWKQKKHVLLKAIDMEKSEEDRERNHTILRVMWINRQRQGR